MFLVELLESWARAPETIPVQRLLVVPALNDLGWDRRERTWSGTDLNRQFFEGTAHPVVGQLAGLFRESPVAVHWDLHEDDEQPDAYVFRYSPDPHDFSTRLAEGLGSALEPWSKWDASSECFVRSLGAERVVTTELPPTWDMRRRIDWLWRAWRIVAREAEDVCR